MVMRNSLLVFLILIPLVSSAQENTKKKAYYFYGEQCSHCKNVDEYFQANGIYDKYDITKLEFSNPFNARLLVKFGEVFNSPYKGSVPAVAFADKFIVGDQPIIYNFVREIDAAENATELPDPEKINSAASQRNQPSQDTSGNKKNYFPVILIALAIIGSGAIVYVNRKKSNA